MRQSSKDNLKILIKISLAIFQGIFVLFVGLLISFIFFDMMISNPYLNRYPGLVDRETYENILEELRLYDPIIIRFRKYIHNFFYGNWGESYIVRPGEEITKMMKTIVPMSIETMILPLLIGLIGIKLGRVWVKKRDKIQGLIIQIFTIIGLAMPLFFMATLMQLEFSDDLPVLFYSDPSIPASERITGFPLLDSILDENWDLAGSIIEHGVLPVITLSFVIAALFIKQTQTNLERNSKDTSFVSNSFTAGKIFGILIALVFIVEITFNRRGFGYYFLMSIYMGDFLLINGCLFMIIMLFSVTMILANIIPIAYKFFRKKIPKKIKLIRKNIRSKIEIYREKIYNVIESFKVKDEVSPPLSEPKIEVEKKYKTKPTTELKNYIITTLKNPFIIVGLGLIIFLVFISVFPQLFTPYSLHEITPPYIPPSGIPFDPPSSDHPLGTTMYGYDILARLIYGTRDALVFGIIVTLIGLAVGSIFGFLAGRFYRYLHNGIIGLMIMFFVIPGLMLLILSSILFGGVRPIVIIIMIIGLLLTINFTVIIANAIRRESSYINVIKVAIKYIPLEMAFGIMLYLMLGYIGLGDETTAQLGITFNYGRGHWSAFEAIYWPGLYIFVIMLSLILLHEGLEAPTAQRDVLNTPVISSYTTTHL